MKNVEPDYWGDMYMVHINGFFEEKFSDLDSAKEFLLKKITCPKTESITVETRDFWLKRTE